jgi:hypothetical protein
MIAYQGKKITIKVERSSTILCNEVVQQTVRAKDLSLQKKNVFSFCK